MKHGFLINAWADRMPGRPEPARAPSGRRAVYSSTGG